MVIFKDICVVWETVTAHNYFLTFYNQLQKVAAALERVDNNRIEIEKDRTQSARIVRCFPKGDSWPVPFSISVR